LVAADLAARLRRGGLPPGQACARLAAMRTSISALLLAPWLLGWGTVLAQPADHAAPGASEHGAAAWSAPTLDRFPSLRWIHTGSDALQYLSSAVSECLHPPTAAAELLLVETGRQLFGAPGLLGTGAAELGLSCQSCHPAGQAQTRFHLPGLSAAPGSVDLQAIARAPGGSDPGLPRPIPPLHDAWRRAGSADLLHSLPPASYLQAKLALFAVEPSPAVLAALSAYLEALSLSACPARAASPLSLAAQLFEITRSVDVLQGNAGVADALLSELLAQAARQRLRALRARFDLPGLAALTAEISAREAALALALQAPHRVAALRDWLTDWQELVPALRAREQDSLYDRDVLERWLLQAAP